MPFDYTEIQKDFDKVLCYSQEQDSVNTDNLFKKWAEAKSDFINQMGGELIYESPYDIAISLPKEAREERIDKYIDVVWNISGEIGDFLKEERDGLFDNKTCVEAFICNHMIPVGMKIGKALHKYFSAYCSADKLEWIIQELSRIIQENTISGRLCFSVHPLDFLSLSENTHKWRSCHALDGEYRDGNLSYMCDKVTAIAYLKSEEDAILPRFPDDVPWNNKKWRCLMFFDKNRHLIWAGRQYPFSSNSALDAVHTRLLREFDYFDPNNFTSALPEWRNNTFKTVVPKFDEDDNESYDLNIPHILYNGMIYPLNNFIKDHKYSNAYNDLLNSHFYTPVYLSYSYTNFSNTAIPPIEIGGEAPCIHCGESHAFDSQTMLCAKDVLTCTDEMLDGIEICPRCGERFIAEEGSYYHYETYCPDCYEEMEVRACPQCGEEFCTEDGYPDEDTGIVYCCRYCYKEATHKSWFRRN